MADRGPADAAGTIVLRHLDRLDPAALRALAAALQGEQPEVGQRQDAWIAVTTRPGAADGELGGLLRAFPRTVTVPPLRHHIEDVQQLVPFLLGRLGYRGQLTCSPEAMQRLLRSSWPGNVEQLLQVLPRVVQSRRTGTIQASDLPAEIGSLCRRLLSPLESMERDAIVHGLLDAEGNKAQAARALGMSRATIYRKIHEYGIASSVEMRRVPAPAGRRVTLQI